VTDGGSLIAETELKSEQNEIRPALLVVEDDEEIRQQIRWAFASEYVLLEAYDRQTALAMIRRQEARLVLLDLGLPPDAATASEGLAALREMLQLDPRTKVIVLTGNEERAVAVEAVQRGAWDYVSKPADLRALRVILSRARHMMTLEDEWLKSQQIPVTGEFYGMIGQSPARHHIHCTRHI